MAPFLGRNAAICGVKWRHLLGEMPPFLGSNAAICVVKWRHCRGETAPFLSRALAQYEKCIFLVLFRHILTIDSTYAQACRLVVEEGDFDRIYFDWRCGRLKVNSGI